ncbi:mucin-2 [Calliphora vicina]|uniref:mucin-2 n=1 Tax=Calliphora vicina TaxID=7373 RepID=UPI00325AEF71
MMRPPVQKSALQQNEANRLQHHQQTHKHLQQQKQFQQQQQQHQQQPDIIATNISDLQQTDTIAHKSKLEQRELLVENHLNSACFAQVHHHQQQQQQPIARPPPPPPARTIARKSLPTFYNDCYQQQQQQQRPTPYLANSSSQQNNRRDSSATVKLLDLSTSPPQLDETVFRTQTTSAEVLQNRISSVNQTNNSQQRFSFASQYSSRSSSSDDSSSLSLTTAAATKAAAAEVGTGGFIVTASGSYNSYNHTFDDAAENFIINFPADTSPLPAQTSHSDYCLPLSETEPLLTNIEATVNDKQRSIYLNKNSASLIFTRKDLTSPQSTLQTKTTAAAAAATYQQHQKQQQFKLQSKTNNNFNGTSSSSTGSKSFSGTTSSATAANSGGGPTNVRHQNHSTLRSFSEENYRRKPTKHLPSTYHQQHRRSLQLNYNNNLVTTTTCGNTIANNNRCCSGNSSNNSSSSNSNSAVLHKTHHNNHSLQQTTLQQRQQQPLSKQQQQGHQHCSLNSNNCAATNNTAATTRKQYAYSWYAPVYSALEEELEQDSRDSSPIHNLANTKKQHINQYHQSHDLNSSLAPTNDNETEALLETRHNINIQSHLPANNLKRESLTKQLHPSKLSLQHTRNPSGKGSHQAAKGLGHSGGGDVAAVEGFANYDLEGPQAGSLGLAGGPQPRRIRFGNFLKSLVGLRPSVSNRNGSSVAGETTSSSSANEPFEDGECTPPLAIPSSPEITITRTPSEQNMVVMRDPSGYREYNGYGSREKLANFNRERVVKSGSTSSLNVMQQKLWNIMRREGSAISLHQEKSQSIVHYTGLRKCETVLALTRQTTSPCSPTMGAGVAASNSRNRLSESHATRLSHTGSGIFSASGVEQIRPLNRLRNSISSMNNTCSRCSSLLSLAASSSRYSLNNATNPMAHTSHQHLRNSSNVSSSNISSTFSRSRDGSVETGLHFAVKRNSRTSALGSQRNSTSGANSTTSSRTPSMTSPTTTTATTASTIKLTTPPTDNSLSVPLLSPPPPNVLTLTSTLTAPAPVIRESLSFPAESSTPLTVTSLLKVTNNNNNNKKEATNININDVMHDDDDGDDDVKNVDYNVIDGVYRNNSISNNTTSPSASSTTSTLLTIAQANVTLSTNPKASAPTTFTEIAAVASTTSESIMATIMQHCNTANDSPHTPSSSGVAAATTTTQAPAPARPFEMFTCKLCLIDVENASNSTILHQCGCQFCTECMKAYVEFEISEGAYEISCPDAQCPEQGVMTLPEIANLTTNNLMKKHHRYRLNREIELDKTRTWCPRAGCETVCLIGSTSSQSDAAPSTSASSTTSTATSAINPATAATTPNGTNAVTTLCAVQCPSCKDEFCSACKKTWHPNITCEEHSRRLAADGQDDIGIPFDNDLIKCCPMCAVPIEKDEGCAQMMCKRCKHVFCWYCLASLDDDFLLRHYDKGPCKNKLGHSRASVVWHRAQVIGIFAGFGILLLVASPLLLLAAPCIICCKCRSCSGSKIDEGDGELDEATALQSLN